MDGLMVPMLDRSSIRGTRFALAGRRDETTVMRASRLPQMNGKPLVSLSIPFALYAFSTVERQV
jgi:hypothetical protein